MIAKIDEGMVFVAACAYHAYYGGAVEGRDAIVFAVASSPFHLSYVGRLFSCPMLIKIQKSFHSFDICCKVNGKKRQ